MVIVACQRRFAKLFSSAYKSDHFPGLYLQLVGTFNSLVKMEMFLYIRRMLRICFIFKPTPNTHWITLWLLRFIYYSFLLTLFLPTCAFIIFGQKELNDLANAIYVVGSLGSVVFGYLLMVIKQPQLVRLLSRTQAMIESSKCNTFQQKSM